MTGSGSPAPFIKREASSEHHSSSDNRFALATSPSGMPQQQFSGFNNMQGNNSGIDPSEIMQGQMQNGSFLSNEPFGYQGSAGYGFGDAGIADDELLDMINLDGNQGPGYDESTGQNFDGQSFPNQDPTGFSQPTAIKSIYSHTPDGNPLQSPYLSNFGQEQFRNMQQQHLAHSIGSPASFNTPSAVRPGTSATRQSIERKGSHGTTKAPMTPKTPALAGLSLGTPESTSLGSQPIVNHHLGQHRHQKSLPNQWESHSGSLQSFADSPLSSPGHASGQPGINDIMSAKHASLPTKVDHAALAQYQQQEAKRRRRRESHNMVERRRRDNINERIQELSHLVPHHRLEDEKVRKHIMNNSPLSPTATGSGISPPQATSLLAGGSGRRAAGGITTGIPPDDKDKGPNKGDILNGSVGWTRDLMWCLYIKFLQEEEMLQTIRNLGGSYPYEASEDERRMKTELMEAIEKNGHANFSYSRGPGSGLRVPKYTDFAGNALDGSDGGNGGAGGRLHIGTGGGRSGLSGRNGGTLSPMDSPADGTQFWSPGGQGNGEYGIKEEDEYGMDVS
jgi:hypothetical protein